MPKPGITIRVDEDDLRELRREAIERTRDEDRQVTYTAVIRDILHSHCKRRRAKRRKSA